MKKFISDVLQNEAVQALAKLVAVPSFNSEAKAKTPFGAGPKKALQTVLKIAGELGFSIFEDPEGYYGYAEIGKGAKTFGVICHVDVVPAGDESKWTTDPFELVEKSGELFGRGVQDDKGPTVAILYAIKSIIDAGYQLKNKIRVIFGTDEEILWRCMAKYNQNEAPIDFGIAPDAEFPLIYAEKGLQQSYIVGPGSDTLELDLLNSFNAVPGKAEYDGTKQEEVKRALMAHEFAFDSDKDKIIVQGNSVHAMNATEGTNAVVRLAIALADVFPGQPMLEFLSKFGEDATGSNILGEVSDQVSGQLTFNISSLVINQNESRIQIDLRIPVQVDHDDLIKKLETAIKPFDLKYENFDYVAPLYVPTDSHMVKTLMETYQNVTGDTKSKPTISGGATFARTMPNTVAFGAMLPSTPDHMHQVDESWSKSDMRIAMEVYAQSIYQLCVK